MATVDFADWVADDLRIPLGGKTYEVQPPSVAQAKVILACAVQSEVRLGLTKRELDDDTKDILAKLEQTPLGEVSLGKDVYDEMVTDGVPAVTINRVALYAVWFWAYGKKLADAFAALMWTKHDDELEGADDSGEAPGR